MQICRPRGAMANAGCHSHWNSFWHAFVVPTSSQDVDQYASSRLQVAGVAVQDVWVIVGMLYGFPCNASHKQAKFQTESMLSELIDKVACQCGPRIIAGDVQDCCADPLHQVDTLLERVEVGIEEVCERDCQLLLKVRLSKFYIIRKIRLGRRCFRAAARHGGYTCSHSS